MLKSIVFPSIAVFASAVLLISWCSFSSAAYALVLVILSTIVASALLSNLQSSTAMVVCGSILTSMFSYALLGAYAGAIPYSIWLLIAFGICGIATLSGLSQLVSGRQAV